jgi:hypothetical protein
VAAASPPDAPLAVASIREVTIPGTRLISMSPDGRLLVGVRPPTGGRRVELCVFDIVTLAEQSCADLSGLDAGLRLEDMAWSPDGRHLAFAERAFVVFRDGDLWLMDTDTGRLTNLDDDGFTGKLPVLGRSWGADVSIPVNPAFSPDGRTIAFSRTMVRDGALDGNDIATVPVGGGEVTTLHRVSDEAGVVYFGIRWSPDGAAIHYSFGSRDRSSPSNGVWRLSLDGSGVRKVIAQPDVESGPPAIAQVASDGTSLVWYPLLMGSFNPTRPPLGVVGVRGGPPEPVLAAAPRAPGEAMVYEATLSPDGAVLMTVERRVSPDHQVFVRPVGGGPATALVPAGLSSSGQPGIGIMPTWASNGTAWISGGPRFDSGTLLSLGVGVAPSAAPATQEAVSGSTVPADPTAAP